MSASKLTKRTAQSNRRSHSPKPGKRSKQSTKSQKTSLPPAADDGSNGHMLPASQPADSNNAPDPFDLVAVKKKAATSVAVKKTLIVQVRKRIDKNTWFQVCPNPEMHIEGFVMDPGDVGDGLFWVSPHVLEEIDDSSIRLYSLHLCITRHGNALFWWAIGLPGDNGRDMECDRVRREYATVHGTWMRLEWDDASRMHLQSLVQAAWPNPDWPNETPDTLIRIAFRGRVIDTPDHPIVQQMKGLA